jgi:hypothetical protein
VVPPEPPPPPEPITTEPGRVPAPTGAAIFRLNLTDTKPFVQKHRGRTIGVASNDTQVAAGWGTHSWQPACAHELVAAMRDGQMALGIRLTAGPASGRPEAMLYVPNVEVESNHDYTLRIEYQSNGEFAGGDIRFREEPAGKLRILGRTNPAPTGWTTTTFRFRTGTAEKLQLEFHHYGPLGEENALFLRAVELTDTR